MKPSRYKLKENLEQDESKAALTRDFNKRTSHSHWCSRPVQRRCEKWLRFRPYIKIITIDTEMSENV